MNGCMGTLGSLTTTTTTTTTMDKEKETKTEVDRFKDVFKYYKRRQPPPDLTQAIDIDSLSEVTVLPAPTVSEEDQRAAQVSGLTPPHTWAIHSLVRHPGLLVVRNPFTRAGQLAWARRCLCELPCATNKTNLASHGIHLTPDRTWWNLCRMSEGRRGELRHKLRWVTLGYHHNWDTKEYSEESRGEMPESLMELCGVVARVLGLGEGEGAGVKEVFRAQAAIINYYPANATLGPHTDHSEPYVTAPLLSFSFGQSAIFLIGGQTKASKPSAVLLHSGDLVVMSGPSRLCYHAVPRILPREEWRRARRRRRKKEEEVEEEEPWLTESCGLGNEDKNEDMNRRKEESEGKKRNEEGMEEDEEDKGKNKENKDKKDDMNEDKKDMKRRNEEIGRDKIEEDERGKEEERKEREEMEVEIKSEDKERKKKNENKEYPQEESIKETENKGEEEEENEAEEPIKRRRKTEEEEEQGNKGKKKDDNGENNDKSINKENSDNDDDDDDDDDDDNDTADILEYLRECRINMNIRQVLPPNKDSLPS